MKKVSLIALAMLAIYLAAPSLTLGQGGTVEQQIWSLEDAYWQYVKANDFEHYRTLWHADFLGWPYSDPEPAGKEQITGWITAHTSKGETLKSYEVERLKARVTGNNVTTTYRAHLVWVDRNGTDRPGSIRIIHTWLRSADGKWQIISGMGAPTNAEGH